MSKLRLDPLIEGYLDYQSKIRRLAPRSVVDIKCTLKRAVTSLEKVRPAVPLWKLALADYMTWLNQQREAGYSPQSLNKDISHLRGLLEYAWRSGRADRNVLDGFSLVDGRWYFTKDIDARNPKPPKKKKKLPQPDQYFSD